MPPGKSSPARKPAKAPSKPASRQSDKSASKAIKVTKAPRKGSTRLVAAEPKATASARPTEQAIRQRAYEIFLARGGAPGDPQQDWDAAVDELRAPKRRLASK